MIIEEVALALFETYKIHIIGQCVISIKLNLFKFIEFLDCF